jgi:hypothetical protein
MHANGSNAKNQIEKYIAHTNTSTQHAAHRKSLSSALAMSVQERFEKE